MSPEPQAKRSATSPPLANAYASSWSSVSLLSQRISLPLQETATQPTLCLICRETLQRHVLRPLLGRRPRSVLNAYLQIDQVGGGPAATQRPGKIQATDGARLGEALTRAVRRAVPLSLEPLGIRLDLQHALLRAELPGGTQSGGGQIMLLFGQLSCTTTSAYGTAMNRRCLTKRAPRSCSGCFGFLTRNATMLVCAAAAG